VIGAYGDKVGGFYGAGSAYVFAWDGSHWTQQAKIVASNTTQYVSFGMAVALDGDTAVVGAGNEGAHGAGATYVFVRMGTNWIRQARIVVAETNQYAQFGGAVALAGDTMMACAPGAGSGSAYIFMRVGTNWVQRSKLTPNDGARVMVSAGRLP